jgi:hypothetical protein
MNPSQNQAEPEGKATPNPASNGSGAGLPDPTDLTALALDPSVYMETGKVKRIRQILAGRPSPQTFFRVHPDPAYRLGFAMVELKEEREDYLVIPALVRELPGEVVHKMLYTTLDRNGTIRLWSVRLPSEDDRKTMLWYKSAHDAAELAKSKWVRLKANMHDGAYECIVAEAEIPEPDWSQLAPFPDLLHSAYNNRVIRTLDHAVIKRLRGLE